MEQKKLLYLSPLSANLKEWSNTLKQFVGNSPQIALSVLDHFVKLALKRLKTTFSSFSLAPPSHQ